MSENNSTPLTNFSYSPLAEHFPSVVEHLSQFRTLSWPETKRLMMIIWQELYLKKLLEIHYAARHQLLETLLAMRDYAPYLEVDEKASDTTGSVSPAFVAEMMLAQWPGESEMWGQHHE